MHRFAATGLDQTVAAIAKTVGRRTRAKNALYCRPARSLTDLACIRAFDLALSKKEFA